jgi:prepilin-type processing-associated H-X9-DG protein
MCGDCLLPDCAVPERSLSRGSRNTKNPLNSTILMLDDNENDVPFGSSHAGGAFFVFADGHVSFLNDSIDMDSYRSLSTYKSDDTIKEGEI